MAELPAPHSEIAAGPELPATPYSQPALASRGHQGSCRPLPRPAAALAPTSGRAPPQRRLVRKLPGSWPAAPLRTAVHSLCAGHPAGVTALGQALGPGVLAAAPEDPRPLAQLAGPWTHLCPQGKCPPWGAHRPGNAHLDTHCMAEADPAAHTRPPGDEGLVLCQPCPQAHFLRLGDSGDCCSRAVPSGQCTLKQTETHPSRSRGRQRTGTAWREGGGGANHRLVRCKGHAGTREPLQRGHKWAPSLAKALEREPAATRRPSWRALPGAGAAQLLRGTSQFLPNQKDRLGRQQAAPGRPAVRGRPLGKDFGSVWWFC